METGPVQLQGITISAKIKETLMGIDTRMNILKGITIGVGTGASIMQMKVVDRNHEPIEGATCRVLNAISGSNDVLSFDGVDDWINVGNCLYLPNNHTFTAEGWVYYDGFSTRDIMLSRNNATRNAAPYTWLLGTISGTSMAAFDGAAWRSVNYTFKTKQWYHLAFSYDGAIMRYYVNGNLIGTSAYTFLDSLTGRNTQLGAPYSGYTGCTKGKYSDIRFWSYAKTGNQINVEKDSRMKGNELGLMAYWKLNDESSTAIDSAGTNNGTIYGATWQEVQDLPIITDLAGFDTTTPYDQKTTNANGLTTLNYKIFEVMGLEVTLPGKRRFIMPFQRDTRGLLDWQVKLDKKVSVLTDLSGNVYVPGKADDPENQIIAQL